MIWLEDDLPEPPAHQGNEHEKLWSEMSLVPSPHTQPPPLPHGVGRSDR